MTQRRAMELVVELTLASTAGAIAGVIAHDLGWLPGVPQPLAVTLGVWGMLGVQRWIARRRIVTDASTNQRNPWSPDGVESATSSASPIDSGLTSAHLSDERGSTIKQDVVELIAWLVLLLMIGAICYLVGRDQHWPAGLAQVVAGTVSTPISAIVAIRIVRRRRERTLSKRRSPWSLMGR
jgi:hypothetical protein